MRENLQKKSKSGLRGLTRLYAIQIMYRTEFERKPLEKALEEAKKNPQILISEEVSLNEIDSEFFTELIIKTKEHKEEIDKLIEKNVAKNWSFDRFDKVMQSLLRLGVCELIFFDQIPANVIFNEYIELAKSFFKKREVGFVNGILNSIFHQQKSA